MIQRSVSYTIYCDVCDEPLVYHDNHILISYRGHVMEEGNPEHIMEVAKEYGWFIEGNIHKCKECVKK